MKNLIISTLLFLSSTAFGLEINLVPQARTYPTSGSAEVSARHEIMLWDQRSDAKWKYGFVQPRVAVATHGLAEAALNFYPISILELGAAYSSTSRYYKTKPFDCDLFVCGGVMTRHRYTVRLVGGKEFESFKLLALATYHRVRISNADNTKPLVDEVEVLAAMPGSDTVESTSLMLGASRDEKTLGLYLKKGKFVDAKTENDMQYLIYRQKMDGYAAQVGLGRYASDYHDPGFSAIVGATWSWGETQSLF
jgi:hypothetical protein